MLVTSLFLKANLGYLDTFLGGILESKFALNNLNFKCYIQFFFVRARIGRKKCNPRIGQHPGKGGVKG